MTLAQVCDEIVGTCLGIRPGETFLLLGHRGPAPGHHALLLDAARRRGATAWHLEVARAGGDGAVHDEVTTAMCAAGAAVLGVPWIFPHPVRRQATQAGARLLSLCTVTDEMLLRAAVVDHRALAAYTRRAADRIGGASRWQVRTPAGTDLTATITGRRVIVLDGMAREPGTASGLPAGVAAVTPVLETAEGRLVLDGSIDGYGLVDDPPTVIIERGIVVDIHGGEAARFLRERFASTDASGRHLCEVGTGTNPRAAYTGNLVEDERVRGSAHVGFGGNTHLGGEHASPLHFDASLRRPSVFLDGEPFVVDGLPVLAGP